VIVFSLRCTRTAISRREVLGPQVGRDGITRVPDHDDGGGTGGVDRRDRRR
jgi:hypothetical protein